jgi:hypothetical protein
MRSLQRIDEAIHIWQTKSNDRYSHIDKNDIEKVYKILTEKRKWYDQTAKRFNSLRQHEDPAVLCSQIEKEREVSHSFKSLDANSRISYEIYMQLFRENL